MKFIIHTLFKEPYELVHTLPASNYTALASLALPHKGSARNINQKILHDYETSEDVELLEHDFSWCRQKNKRFLPRKSLFTRPISRTIMMQWSVCMYQRITNQLCFYHLCDGRIEETKSAKSEITEYYNKTIGGVDIWLKCLVNALYNYRHCVSPWHFSAI